METQYLIPIALGVTAETSTVAMTFQPGQEARLVRLAGNVWQCKTPIRCDPDSFDRNILEPIRLT